MSGKSNYSGKHSTIYSRSLVFFYFNTKQKSNSIIQFAPNYLTANER